MAPRNKAQRKKTRLPPPPPKRKTKTNRSMILAIAIIAVIVIVFGVIVVTGQLNQPASTPTKVLLETSAGNITLELRTDKPITTTNFINLVEEGRYDGSTFHRVSEGFMIQGGKVNGSVATIQDEIGSNNHNAKYTIAMAKTINPNSATSEFFINVADNTDYDSTYTVFGTVIDGKDVVDAIATAPTVLNPSMPYEEYSLPVDPVVILHATIVS